MIQAVILQWAENTTKLGEGIKVATVVNLIFEKEDEVQGNGKGAEGRMCKECSGRGFVTRSSLKQYETKVTG